MRFSPLLFDDVFAAVVARQLPLQAMDLLKSILGSPNYNKYHLRYHYCSYSHICCRPLLIPLDLDPDSVAASAHYYSDVAVDEYC